MGERMIALLPLMEVKSRLTGRRGVCLPFSDFCGPLRFGPEASAIGDGVARLEHEREWKYTELRGESPGDFPTHQIDTFYTHTLDLTLTEEELFAAFDDSARRATRKAERNGLKVARSFERESVLEYYRLHARTRRRHGIPPQSLSFFLNLHEHVIRPGLGFVMTASLGARAVASAIFLTFGKRALYKFGASDERMQALRGNNLVMREALRFLAGSGLASLHLGRTALEHAGLRRFKLSLGAKEETLRYFRSGPSHSSAPRQPSRLSLVSNMLFRGLPLTVNRLAGTILYPHLH